MFRPSSQKGARARLRRGVSRATSPDASDGHSTPIERIFSLVLFISSIFLTLIISPSKIDEKINGDKGVQKLVPKYTFLTLCTFAATKAIRMFMTIVLFALLPWVRGCEPENQQPIDLPTVAKEMAWPSLSEILLVGIPSVIVILLLLVCARRLLKFVISAKDAARFFNVAIYIAGFQYVLLCAIITCMIPVWDTGGQGLNAFLQAASVLIPIPWAAALLTVNLLRILWRTRPARSLRRKIATVCGVAFACLILSALIWLAGIVVAVPLAIWEVEPQLVKPMLQVMVADSADDDDGKRRVRLMVRNVTKDHLYLAGQDVTLIFDDLTQDTSGCSHGALMRGKVEEWDLISGGGKILAPGQPEVITINLRPHNGQGDCGFEELVRNRTSAIPHIIRQILPAAYLIYPTPENYWARIKFRSVDAQGTKFSLVAFVHGRNFH